MVIKQAKFFWFFKFRWHIKTTDAIYENYNALILVLVGIYLREWIHILSNIILCDIVIL